MRSAMVAAAVIVVAGVSAYTAAGRNAAEASSSQRAAARVAQDGGGVCYHTFVSEYRCPDSSAARMVFNQEDIAGISLTVTTRAGQRRTFTLPGGVDAVMLTKEATEKFLLSYYWAVDRAKAEQLTRQLGRAATR
jgi:hypothetical protein